MIVMKHHDLGSIDKGVVNRLIAKFGEKTQMRKFQEELLELALSINQHECPTKSKKKKMADIIEEIADVKITLAQAETIIGQEVINAAVQKKIERIRKKYL